MKRAAFVASSFILILAFASSVHAQMLQTLSLTPTPELNVYTAEQADVDRGKSLLTSFNNRKLTCNDLKNEDLEHIGEYMMNHRFNDDIVEHVKMNLMLKQAMGEEGEEQMHILIGQKETGCPITAGEFVTGMFRQDSLTTNWQSGTINQNLWTLFWVIAIIDLVLLGVFMVKKLRMNPKK